jgi:hypothetical protein
LFVLPDTKWDIFYGNSIEAPHKAFAGALVVAGPDTKSGADVRIPLSADSTKRVFFEVAKAVYPAASSRQGQGKIPHRVIERLKESAEQATQQKIKGAR